MHLDRDFVGQLTPLQCRNGPIKSQQCTDFHCCVIYLVLIGIAFFFSLLSMGGIKMTPQQIQLKVSQTKFGAPLYSIMQAWVPIIVSLSFIAAICIIFVLTSFIIPAIITFIYIPLLQLILLGGGTIFLLRYLGIKLPFIQEDIQARFAHQSSTYTLILSIAFYVGFLAAFFTLCLKRSKIRYIYPVLRIAKIAFWPNFYIFCFPFIFSILSIATIIGNVALLSISLTRKTQIIHKNTAAILILIQAFMTHGLIISLSDFFAQSIAIHWYYKKRRDFTKEGRCCDTLFLTLQMMVRHIGTIVHGFIIAYIPETLNTFISRFEGKSALCYHVLCLWHKFTIRDLSKYCYFQTIMQSFQFGIANRQMYGLRQRAKKVVPQIYMMGSFYATLTKICSGVMGLILCYFLMGNSPELADQFSQPSKLIGPLIIVFFGGQEISNHFMNVTGILGDTIVFAYFTDIQIEKKDFGDAQPYSCPNEIRDIIYQVKAGQQYISD